MIYLQEYVHPTKNGYVGISFADLRFQVVFKKQIIYR